MPIVSARRVCDAREAPVLYIGADEVGDGNS